MAYVLLFHSFLIFAWAAATATAAAATTALWVFATDPVAALGSMVDAELIDGVCCDETDGTTSTKLFKSEFEKLALCLPRIWSFKVSFLEYR